MQFAQGGNYLNEDAFLFLQHEGMEHSEETIDYSKIISYEFTQYSMKSGLKEPGEKGVTAVTEELSHLHMRDTFLPKLAKHLTKKQKLAAL